jgi:hypothetical protein
MRQSFRKALRPPSLTTLDKVLVAITVAICLGYYLIQFLSDPIAFSTWRF